MDRLAIDPLFSGKGPPTDLEEHILDWIGDTRLILMALSLGDEPSVRLAAELATLARRNGALVFVWAHHPLYSARIRVEAPAEGSLQLLRMKAQVLLELAEESEWREPPLSEIPQSMDPGRAGVVAGIVRSIEDLCRLVGRFPIDDALRELQSLFPGILSPVGSKSAYRGHIALGWAETHESTELAIQRAVHSPFLRPRSLGASHQVLIIVSGGEDRGEDLGLQVGKRILEACPAGVDVLYNRVPLPTSRTTMGITVLATSLWPGASVSPAPPRRRSGVFRLRRGDGAAVLRSSEPPLGNGARAGGPPKRGIVHLFEPRQPAHESPTDG